MADLNSIRVLERNSWEVETFWTTRPRVGVFKSPLYVESLFCVPNGIWNYFPTNIPKLGQNGAAWCAGSWGEQTCYIKTLPTFLRFSDLRKLEFSRLGSGAGRARLLIGWCQSQSGVPGEIVSLGYFAAKREKRERDLDLGNIAGAAAASPPQPWILLIFVLEIARHWFYSLLAPGKLYSDSASQIPDSLP